MDSLRKLGREIDRLLNGRSQRWLEEQSGITQATVSRLIHGKHRPSPETLEALARPLGVAPVYLFRLAGLSIPAGQYDPEAAYIAQRLTALPLELRKEAIDALSIQLDTIYKAAGIIGRKQPTQTPEVPITQVKYDTLIEELVQIAREMRDTDPEALERIMASMQEVRACKARGDEKRGVE